MVAALRLVKGAASGRETLGELYGVEVAVLTRVLQLYTTRASDGINNIIFGFTYGVERSAPPNYSARNSFEWWLLSTKHF